MIAGNKKSSFLMLGIMLLVGIYLLIRPGETLFTAAKIMGAALVVIGAIGLVNQLLLREKMLLPVILVYAVEIVAGIILFSSPDFVISLLPIILGIVVVIYGLSDVQTALRLKKAGHPAWKRALVFSLITVVLGIILLLYPFETVAALVRVLGVILIYKAIVGILLRLA